MNWRRRKSPQVLHVGGVLFQGEQDGIPEQNLKRQLTNFFQSRPDITTAWLAIVAYQGAPDRNVALCITGVPETSRAELAKTIGQIFAALFNTQEQLDIIFPTDAQRTQLEQVCRPFFTRDQPASQP